MIELLPEFRRALVALRDMSREIGATEIVAMVDAGLAGDPNGLLRCGLAIGAVSASLTDLIGRWDALPPPEEPKP